MRAQDCDGLVPVPGATMAVGSIGGRRGRTALLLAAVMTLLATPSSGATAVPKEAARPHFRLPGDISPTNYTLRIITHFRDDDFRFYGQVVVDLDVLRDTSEVRLHAKRLTVDQQSVSLSLLNEDNDVPEDVPVQQQQGDQDEAAHQHHDQEPSDVKQPLHHQEKETHEQIADKQRPAPQQQQDKEKQEQSKGEQQQQQQQDKEKQEQSKGEQQQQQQQDKEKQEQSKGEQQQQQQQDKEKQEQSKGEQQQQQDKEKQEQSKEEQQQQQQQDKEKQEQSKGEQQQQQQQDKEKQEQSKGEQQQQQQQDKEKQEQSKEEQQQQQQQDKEKQEQSKVKQQPQQQQDGQNVERTQQPDPKQERDRRSGHYQHAAGDVSLRGLVLANVSLDAALEQLVVSLSAPLRAGARYRLSLRYWGTLNTEDRGYYRGSYVVGNQTRWVSSTVFEPAWARSAFPCFDEPHMKANFTLVLGRHANYSSSANMPLDRTEPMPETPGWFWDYYRATPKMSTYLVAFMVHDLEGSNASSPSAVRAWAAPGRVRQSDFSLWVAPQVLSVLGGALGASPGLPKHDLVVVPGFRSEALENWGLVSFEERHLLLPGNASQLNKQSVATVVAHELAHVWFGNMLTPAWWSDIWLSEGFATYYSAEALEKIFPAWRFHETAAGNAFLLVMATDAKQNSVPLVHPADDPAKLEAIFSATTYYKGYWMLRMLRGVLGADVFDAGIRRYVREHKYASVDTRSLWNALQGAVDARAKQDLQAAATAPGGDVIVVDDDDEADEDFGRVVVQTRSTTSTTSPPPSGSTSSTASTSAGSTESPQAAGGKPGRARRDAGKAPIAQLVLGMEDPAERDSDETGEAREPTISADRTESPEASPGQEALDNGEVFATGQVSVNEHPGTPAGSAGQEKKAPAADDVQSPPRRGPAPTGYTARVGWLPRPVANIMRNWVQQPGYPVISVYRNLETGVVTLNQRRFLAVPGGGAFGPCNASSATWWVPLRFSTQGSAASTASNVFWMPPTCANVTLPVKVARDEYVVLNVGLVGLYRVHYDPRTLQQLSRLSRAEWLQVAPVTRLQLVSDSLDLARLGRSPYQHALRLAHHMARDGNALVWRAALPHLLMLQRQLRGRRDGVALRSWLQDLVSPHAASIGFATRAQDSPNQASLRVKVTALACHADHAACQRKAKKALKQLMAGDAGAIVPGRLTHTQLCAAVRWGGPAEWRFLRAELSSPASVLPRKAVVGALGCSRDQETLRSLLADTVDANSTLRRADVAAVLTAVASNEVGADITLRFMEERAAQLFERLGDKPAPAERAVRDVAAWLNTKRQLDRLDAVLRQFQLHTTLRSPPSWGRDVVRENIRWAERSRGDVSRWLRARLDDDDLELRGPSRRRPPPKGAKGTKGTKAPPKAAISSSSSKGVRRAGRTGMVGESNEKNTVIAVRGFSNDDLLNTFLLNSQSEPTMA